MSEFSFAKRQCTIKPGAFVLQDCNKSQWMAPNFPIHHLTTSFNIDKFWGSGNLMVTAFGYGESGTHNSGSYGNGGITIMSLDDVVIAPIPQLTVEEVRFILFNPALYSNVYIPTEQRESKIAALTKAINESLNPHFDVVLPFVKALPIRKVVSAANFYKHPLLPNGELIVTGARHGDGIMNPVLDAIEHAYDIVLLDHEQGFIDQWGEFMDRHEAYEVVQKSGQFFDPKRNVSTNELYSEGIY